MTAILETIKDKAWTDEEFMALADDGDRYEIVDGELVNLGNSGMEHGNIGIFLGGAVVPPSEEAKGIYAASQKTY